MLLKGAITYFSGNSSTLFLFQSTFVFAIVAVVVLAAMLVRFMFRRGKRPEDI